MRKRDEKEREREKRAKVSRAKMREREKKQIQHKQHVLSKKQRKRNVRESFVSGPRLHVDNVPGPACLKTKFSSSKVSP